MAQQLSEQELKNNLTFLERCQLVGHEAEALVHLRYKLVSMLEEAQMLSKQPAKPPPKKAVRKPRK